MVEKSSMQRDLKSSFDLLKSLIPFDAAQLLRIERGRRPVECFRTGYSSNTAWALAHMFPIKSPGGFTQYASADAPLPPTISTTSVRSEFTSSRLFREYLSEEGFAEGMTLELFSSGGPVGLAHFSSRTARAFEGAPRKVALAVSGFLGQLVMLMPEPELRDWPASEDSGFEKMLMADNEFVEHLRGFQQSPLAFVEHLWWVGDRMVEVGLTQPGRVEARLAEPSAAGGLSRQELAVLSTLCCGVSDSEAARRLHLSVRTVQSHVSSLRRRLQAESRLEAVVIALSAGIYVPHPSWAPLREIARGRPSSAS